MINKFINIVTVVFVLIPALSETMAQNIYTEAKLDTNVILVGDQVGFHLNVQVPENYTINWPVFRDTICLHVEILSQSDLDTSILENGLLNINQILTLTSFDSGYYVLPPVKFDYSELSTNTAGSVETEPFLLNVFSVSVDTSQTIKPIKGPIEAPYTLVELMPWIISAVIFFLLVTGVIFYVRRRKQKAPVFRARPKPKQPPHQIALQGLDKLKAEKLWQKGFIKDYHTRLTDILREYIENRYAIRAVELTTHEIILSIKGVQIVKDEQEKLGQMLELADLVKFAKFKPLPSEHDQGLTSAYGFVNNTKVNITNGNLETSETKTNIEVPA